MNANRDNVMGRAAGTDSGGRLPPANTTRWVPSRKADVVRAIRDGVIDRAEACARYALSVEELRLWERAIDAAGIAGLRVTRVQVYREVFERRH
jgi:hypothetical protein